MRDFSFFVPQGPVPLCSIILRRIINPIMGYFFSLALIASCQPIAPGERSVIKPQSYPDPTQFGTTIHPILQVKCASSKCHGRPTTFRLHEATTPMSSDPKISSPILLLEPFRTDYYSVMYFVDLDLPVNSELLRFGGGVEKVHAGGAALSSEDVATILHWLEADGINP
jgi:hypothetical protein